MFRSSSPAGAPAPSSLMTAMLKIDCAQTAGRTRFSTMYHQWHSIGEEELISSMSNEGRSAGHNAEEEDRSILRWEDASTQKFKLVQGTRACSEVYQRQQIPILEGEPSALAQDQWHPAARRALESVGPLARCR